MTVAAYRCLESAPKGRIRSSPAYFLDVKRKPVRALMSATFQVFAAEELSRELDGPEAAG